MYEYDADRRCLTLYPAGEIDHHRAAALRERADALIERLRPQTVTLDFSGVTFCDSSAIAYVLGRYKKMHARGGAVTLRNLPKQAERIFRLAAVEKLVKIEEGSAAK